jgi:hypothetical protein
VAAFEAKHTPSLFFHSHFTPWLFSSAVAVDKVKTFLPVIPYLFWLPSIHTLQLPPRYILHREMPRRNNSPGDSSDTEPFKCTRCGRVEDEPGKPKDPRPWVCSHCQHDFETEFALKVRCSISVPLQLTDSCTGTPPKDQVQVPTQGRTGTQKGEAFASQMAVPALQASAPVQVLRRRK